MITLNTPRFGELKVPEEKAFIFPEGLIGFPSLRRFVILDYRDTELQWLQSVDEPDIAFMVINPFLLTNEYQFELPEPARVLLEVEDPSEVVTLVILRVEGGKVIANFQGPLVINSRTRKGLQLVLEDNSVNRLNRILELGVK
jgi:flagellar assembly factor FliW